MEFMKQRFGLDIAARTLSQHAAIDRRYRGRSRQHFCEFGAALPLIKDGKLRALAVSSSTRLPAAARYSAIRPRPLVRRTSKRCRGT